MTPAALTCIWLASAGACVAPPPGVSLADAVIGDPYGSTVYLRGAAGRACVLALGEVLEGGKGGRPVSDCIGGAMPPDAPATTAVVPPSIFHPRGDWPTSGRTVAAPLPPGGAIRSVDPPAAALPPSPGVLTPPGLPRPAIPLGPPTPAVPELDAPTPAPVPLPGGLALLMAALGALPFIRRLHR